MPKLKKRSENQKTSINSQARKLRRCDTTVREAEKSKDTKLRQKKRLIAEVQVREGSRNTKYRRQKRQIHEVRVKEQLANTQSRQQKRRISEVHVREQNRNTVHRQQKRRIHEVRVKEQSRNTIFRQQKRRNPVTRRSEQVRNTVLKSTKRHMDLQQLQKAASKRISTKYKGLRTLAKHRTSDKRIITREQVRDSIRRRVSRINPDDLQTNVNTFLQQIKQGPTITCSSCGGLWFRSSVSKVSCKDLLSKGCSQQFIDQVLHIPMGSTHWLCFTCKKAITMSKTPRLNLSNGLNFPKIPNVLKDLTTLEERFCALRNPFLQIRSLGVDRQCGLRGNVVHIQNDIDDAVAVLPRQFDETSIVQVQLMRHMDHNRPYLFQSIRPTKILQAVKYLITTPIYIEEGATMSDVWETRACALLISEKGAELGPRTTSTDLDSDDDDPDDLPVNPGGHETLFLNNDPSEVLKIAPGQGKKPMSLLNDVNGEIACYPTLYGGQRRDFKVNLSYSEIARSETRRYDRRCAVPHKLLHSYKILQNTQVRNAVNLCLRKKKGNGITAGNLLDGETVNKLISHDAGFRLLKQVRTSPAYWEQKQKHVCAMIRQLGIPTLFLTLSAAETHWPELLVILKNILDGIDITEDAAMSLTYEEKANLIRRDPVTCSRFFDYRLRKCFTHLFRKKNGVFKKYTVVDFFWRIEFQHRGSPHAHILFWLKHAPKYEPKDPKAITKCVDFIDQIISCEANTEGVIHQQHRHTKTCKRETKDGVICRFNIPYPPLPDTMILQPYPADYPRLAKAADRVRLAKVKLYLEDRRKNLQNMPFEEFLTLMTMTKDQYIAAIRSGIKRPTVFLKRSIDSCFTNAYLPSLAKAWHANMDIQFILEPYGCAKYIASYISKACGGMSNLLKKAADMARAGKLPLKEQFRKIANTFLNGSEISAQEAAYAVLGIPLTNCTRDVIFIPTGPPDERVFLVKSEFELQKLPESSKDIAVSGLLEHYVQRPDELDTMCLAEFSAMYTYSSKRTNLKKDDPEEHERSQEIETEVEEKRVRFIPLKDKSGYMRKRKLARVIRFRRYGETTDPKDFCREQLMLYHPWRIEESELIHIDAEQVYIILKDQIEPNRRLFNINKKEIPIDEILQSIESSNSANEPDEEYEVMDFCNQEADILRELFPEKNANNHDKIQSLTMIDEESFKKLILSLNDLQAQYACYVMERLKADESFQDFVFGGAGTGKSMEIKAIVQCILRQFNLIAGCDPSTPKVLLCAPTGKAAYNIRGSTLHQVFMLPLNQFGGKIPRLSDDMCNTLSCKFRNLRLLIVDEISMVSCEQLYQISYRLQQIFKNIFPFGGKSICVFGDLHQLRPVGATYVFVKVKGDLGDLIGNPLWEMFRSYELTEIMRQKDDAKFAEALNRLAVGQLTTEDILMFKSREVTQAGPPPQGCIHLFGDNKSVDQFNSDCLSKMTTETAISNAFDLCQGKGKASWKVALLDSVKNMSSRETMGLSLTVKLTLDAKYMITLNVDTPDGLANGTTGVLKKISYGTTTDGKRIPTIGWMSFAEDNVGQCRKKTCKTLYKLHGVTDDWIPIQLERRTVKRWPGRDLEAVRAQIPLTPAEAITVHKSQGATFDQVAVHIGKGMTRQSLYVACSRARSLSGLYLIGDFKAPICREDDVVEKEILRLKSCKLIVPKYTDPATTLTAKQSIVINLSLDQELMEENQTFSECLKSFAKPETVFNKTRINSVVFKPTLQNCIDVTSTGPLLAHQKPLQTIDNVDIYKSDMDSLKPEQWLSDAVVGGFLNLVVARSRLPNRGNLPTVHNFGVFFHLFLRQNQRFSPNIIADTAADVMTFPICDRHHWTIVVADRRISTIFEYDPLENFGLHPRVIEDVKRFLNDVDGKERPGSTQWQVNSGSPTDFPKQLNGFDCGLFILRAIDFLSTNTHPNFTGNDMTQYRNYVHDSIMQSSL